MRPSEAEVVSEIEATNIGIVDDLVGPTMCQHFACMNNVGAVDETQRFAHIMVGDQTPIPRAVKWRTRF